MNKSDYLDKFIDKMGESLLKDLKSAIPKSLETIIEQRFKGIMSALEPVERIEQEQRSQGKDIENLTISYKKLEEDFAELKINYMKLPKAVENKVQDVIQEENKNMAKAIASDMDQASDKKGKGKVFLRFWKRKSKEKK